MSLNDFAPLSYGRSLPQASRVPGQVQVYGSNGVVGSHNQCLVTEPMVIIGRKGSVGEVHYAPNGGWPIDTTFYITGDLDRDIRFSYYLLKYLDMRHMSSDSAVPGLNRDAAHALEVLIPPFAEQRAIAEVLGALDDKIEANRRVQDTAEAIAHAELARAQQESAESDVPIGQLVERVTEMVQPSDWPEDTTYIGLEHMPRGSVLLKEHGLANGLASTKAIFRPKDVLFGKLRPYFKKVVVAPSSGVCSTDILA